MFIRKKRNKSGVISVQIIDKSRGKYQVLRTVGSSRDPYQLAILLSEAKQLVFSLTKQEALNFDIGQEHAVIDLFFNGINEIRLLGPELLLGKLFDEIGFSHIKDKLFRPLVLTRLGIFRVAKRILLMAVGILN